MLLDFHSTDLHLIFEKSRLKNQGGLTWFFVYFEIDFYCLCSLQNSSLKSTENQVHPTWFFKLDFSKTKCKSIGGKYQIKTSLQEYIKLLCSCLFASHIHLKGKFLHFLKHCCRKNDCPCWSYPHIVLANAYQDEFQMSFEIVSS